MSEREIPNFKFHSIDNKFRKWNINMLSDEVKKGIVGPTKSLVGDFSNEQKIIEVMEALRVVELDYDDIISFRTEYGFDYQNFLRYLITNDKLVSINVKWLENFVYYQELMSKKKRILKRFYEELLEIEDLVDERGSEALKDTSYGLISFLCMYASRNVEFRKKYRDILLDISKIMNRIDNKTINSKEKESVRYKGVTIKLFGDDIDELKDGLTKVMQAINKMPPPFRKQLSKTGYIRITDCPAPHDFITLIETDKHLKDKNLEMFYSDASFSHGDFAITFHNIGQYFKSVLTIGQVLAHELGHSIDYTLIINRDNFSLRSSLWENAKKADGNSINQYADKFITEDFAEFCEKYVLFSESARDIERLRERYPNRLRILEEILDLRMYNRNKPNKMPRERKIEIARDFDGEYYNAMRILLTKKRIKEIYSMPPEKRLEFAQEMVTNGIIKQFNIFFGYAKYFKGMSVEDIRQLNSLFDIADFDIQFNILRAIFIYGTNEKLIDLEKIVGGISSVTPISEEDSEKLEYFRSRMEGLRIFEPIDIKYYFEKLGQGANHISAEVKAEIADIILDGFKRREDNEERSNILRQR